MKVLIINGSPRSHGNTAAQFHPEFKSRPNKPQPLFYGFVKAALESR